MIHLRLVCCRCLGVPVKYQCSPALCTWRVYRAIWRSFKTCVARCCSPRPKVLLCFRTTVSVLINAISIFSQSLSDHNKPHSIIKAVLKVETIEVLFDVPWSKARYRQSSFCFDSTRSIVWSSRWHFHRLKLKASIRINCVSKKALKCPLLSSTVSIVSILLKTSNVFDW